jgi:predicted Rossmann fold nucleotide-binding protein DprA/Smf involved in DNA uptake
MPESITVLGNVDLLSESSVALFCSMKCPGSIILKTYDLAQKLTKEGFTIIGGFHSPVEREVLNVVLKSKTKGHLSGTGHIDEDSTAYRKLLDEARLLIVSVTGNQRQPDTTMAERRNQLAGALAAQVCVLPPA